METDWMVVKCRNMCCDVDISCIDILWFFVRDEFYTDIFVLGVGKLIVLMIVDS